jgi:hypothetical protein
VPGGYGAAYGGYPGTPADSYGAVGAGAEPGRPRRGAAVAGGLLALALALEITGWQIFYVQKYDDPGFQPHLYKHLITGERAIDSLLAAPPYYASWATVALAVLLAAAAFARAPLARTLGVALGFLVAVNGVLALDTWHTEKLLFKSGEPTYFTTQQYFLIAELAIGVALVVLLSLKAGAAFPAGRPAWGPQPGGWGGPPQQPPYRPPYQASRQSPQQAPQQPPGAFGPPPNLPPNLPPQQSQPPQQPPASYGYPPSAPPSTPASTPPSAPPGTPPPPSEPPRGQ